MGRRRAVDLALRAASVGLLCVLAGCANDGGGRGGDPGARAMPAGQSCQSVRTELNRMDSRGMRPKVEAATQGQKQSPQVQAEVDRYNELLNLYLGARCHV